MVLVDTCADTGVMLSSIDLVFSGLSLSSVKILLFVNGLTGIIMHVPLLIATLYMTKTAATG